MITKKITGAGAVTIPKELRAELGIPIGTVVDIDTDGEYIMIRKHIPICRFCGGTESVTSVFGIEICRKCAKKIYIKAGAEK